jgi:hypothetical protein
MRAPGPLMPMPRPPQLPAQPMGAYRGEPGSGEPGGQPFKVDVSNL